MQHSFAPMSCHVGFYRSSHRRSRYTVGSSGIIQSLVAASTNSTRPLLYSSCRDWSTERRPAARSAIVALLHGTYSTSKASTGSWLLPYAVPRSPPPPEVDRYLRAAVTCVAVTAVVVCSLCFPTIADLAPVGRETLPPPTPVYVLE